MDLSDEDLQLPGPRPSSTPLYSLGSLQLEVTPTTNSTMSKTDSTPTFLVTTPTSDADGGSHSSEEELEEINKTTPPLLPNSSSSSSLLSATPPGIYIMLQLQCQYPLWLRCATKAIFPWQAEILIIS